MNETSPRRAPRRTPGRRQLAMLALRLHTRTIAWVAGLVAITLTLGAIGILQAMTVGEPIARSGTIVGVSSSQSIHVQVLLESGEAVLVPREQHHRLAQGDRVTVLESANALAMVGYRLAEVQTR